MKMKSPPNTRRYDLAIIGRGLVGSAAARHAAKILSSRNNRRESRIVLIGPSEEQCSTADPAATVFGAHFDEGRITRRTDIDPIWVELASRSISRYGEIVQESGGVDDFYSESGHLAVGPDGSDTMRRRKEISESMEVDCDYLDEGTLITEFPHLKLPQRCVGIHERKKSGYISARGLVKAQTAAAQKLGVEVVDDIANGVERCKCESDVGRSYFRIKVGSSDHVIEADKVLVAAGAFCNSKPLLPTELELTPMKTQTVQFVLNGEDASRLREMPSIIVKNEDLWAYVLPPIRYPDGTVRLKLGGSYLEPDGKEYGIQNREMHSHQELVDWYRGGGSNNARRDMEGMLRSLVPNVRPISVLSNTCATLNTPTKQAFIGEVEEGWAVATGGNGLAAKSSDELGRLAATCVLDSEAFYASSICGKLSAEVFRPILKPPREEVNRSMTMSWNELDRWEIAGRVAMITAKTTKQVAKELTTKRKDGVLPKAVADLIERIEGKGEIVERMVVVRTPVQEYVKSLMQVVSFGNYRNAIQESYYDRMFHLSLLINGRYVLQKNEVIDLKDIESPRGIERGSEVMAVAMKGARELDSGGPLTFALLLARTRRRMGPVAFSNYCAKTNNCQHFIRAVLESNGLAYPHLVSFVEQDSEDVFNRLPVHTGPVAKALTDVAAVGNKVAEDFTVKHQETDYGEIMHSIGGSLSNNGGRIIGSASRFFKK